MQREALEFKRSGRTVAFVPTMGCLHEGHLSLVRKARRLAGAKGRVVVSIYVNPTQFAPTEDLAKYPRDLARDKRLCRNAGVDLLFIPADRHIYPPDFSTFVVENDVSQAMEGASRPTHFRGVTTIVAKLFHLVRPDIAVFGAKDFQQAAVVRRMVRDLNFPVKIVVAPTSREPDGLALSSRNQYLSPDQRSQATVLWRAIQAVRELIRRNQTPVSASRLKKHLKRMIMAQPAARLDYIEFFDPETLRPLEKVRPGTHLALAVFIGKTRLIDNGRL